MEIRSNVPTVPCIYVDGDNAIMRGNRVRILLRNKNEYIGYVREIFADYFIIQDFFGDPKEFLFSQVDKMKVIEATENLNNTPYYDESEREFWRTHIISRGGIVLR